MRCGVQFPRTVRYGVIEGGNIMATRSNFEVKVGLFVMIGILLLSVLVFSIGDFYLKPGYNLKLIFSFANGVEASAPVRLAGVKVGEVKDIKVVSDPATSKTQVEILIWLEGDVRVERDAKVYINTLGLLGEKYIELIPGTYGSAKLKDGDVLTGQDPVSMEKLTVLGYEILDKLNGTVESLNKVLGDADVQASLKETITNSKAVTEELKNILGRLDRGEGSLGKLLASDDLYNELDAFVRDIRQNPWKLLHKTKEVPVKPRESAPQAATGNKGFIR